MAQQLVVVAPPPPQKDGAGLRAPVTGSSSLGPEARPREEVISAAEPTPEVLALSSPAEVPKALEPLALLLRLMLWRRLVLRRTIFAAIFKALISVWCWAPGADLGMASS